MTNIGNNTYEFTNQYIILIFKRNVYLIVNDKTKIIRSNRDKLILFIIFRTIKLTSTFNFI